MFLSLPKNKDDEEPDYSWLKQMDPTQMAKASANRWRNVMRQWEDENEEE